MSTVKLLAAYSDWKSVMAACTDAVDGCTNSPARLIMFIQGKPEDTASA
jgi:hypothetical protein